MTVQTYEILIALAIVAGFALAFVGIMVDVDRLIADVAHRDCVDELWDDGTEIAA